MQRTVRLYGRLKKQFGAEFKFEAETPAECVRAMCMLVPGFTDELKQGAYKFVRGNRQTGLYLQTETLTLQLGGCRELHLIPAAPNAKGGVGKIIMGVALIGLAFATGGASLGPTLTGVAAASGTAVGIGGLVAGSALGVFAASIGFAMVLGGISALLTPKPKMNKPKDDARDQSFLFSGATNTAQQGVAVPIVYGRVRAGSVVVSAGLDVEQISTGSGYGDDGFGGGIQTDPSSGSLSMVTPDGHGVAGTDSTWIDGSSSVDFNKGGKGSSTTSSTPQEGPNTLQSNATVRLIDVISEGPCVGLTNRSNPMESAYLDDVPLQEQDGTYNHKGIQITERLGNPSDDPVPGFDAVENERSVGIQVTKSVSPVVAISDTNVTEARVTLTIPSLFSVDTKDGSVDPTTVAFKIEVQPNGGSYVSVADTSISGKTNSQYQKAFRFVLPGVGPWNIRVTRVTNDSALSSLQNDLYFSNLTEITSARLMYPDTAYLAVQADAKQFGSNIPARAYDWTGRIIRVPANYNPTTRAYATSGTGTTGGVWDGTFKLAWTDNPAWILYDILTHPRYGLGNDIPETYNNKWALYEIGQYCDALVPDGAGGTQPRYTINTQIVDRGEAWDLLMSIISVFRGMFYWGAGQLEFSYDHDETPVKIVTKANVLGGKINYSSDPFKSRHSVAIISWNDPELGYRPNYEIVEDPALIKKYGYKTIETTAWGCTSRGQAHRVGRWILDTERYGELVQYSASIDHADVRPGTVVEINDPEYLSYRNAGRLLVGSTATVLQLDATLTKLSTGGTVKVVLPDGTVVQKTVTNGAGDTSSLTLSSALPSIPLDGAMWSYAEPGVTNRLWRVLAVEESGPMEFRVTAMFHDPNKFARVERDIDLAPNTFSNLLSSALDGPTNLSLTDVFLIRGGTQSSGLLASWTPADDPRVTFYEYQVKQFSGGDWGVIGNTPRVSVELDDKVVAADYDLRVRSCTNTGQRSKWRLLSQQTLTGGLGPIAAPTGLAVFTNASAAQAAITWGDKPSTEYRSLSYEVLFHATSTNVALATSLGVTRSRQFAITQTGVYFVRGLYGTATGAEAHIAVTSADLPNTLILQQINDISSDSVLSPAEKIGLVQRVQVLTLEHTDLDAQATAFGVTTEKTSYDNAYSALTTYLGGLTPAYTDTTQSTAITRTTFNTNFTSFYSARQALLNKIDSVASTTAAWTGVTGTGKPEDNADVTSAHAALGDANRVRLSQWEKGQKGWTNRQNTGGLALTVTVGSNNNRRYISTTGTFTAAGQNVSICTDFGVADYRIPVIPTERIYVGALPRVDATPAGSSWSYLISYLDVAGVPINGSTQTIATGSGVLVPEQFKEIFTTVPAGANYAFIELVLTSGASGAFSFSLYNPMISGAGSAQTIRPQFNDGKVPITDTKELFDGSGLGSTAVKINPVPTLVIYADSNGNVKAGELPKIIPVSLSGGTVNGGAPSTTVVAAKNGVASLDSTGKVPISQMPFTSGGGGDSSISPKAAPFNAAGDGVTDDTTAVLNALTYAFDNGLPVDGGDFLYAISGGIQFSSKVRPWIRRLRVKQLVLTTATQTLYLLNCDRIRIDDLFVDSGTAATVGDRDTTTLGIRIEGGTGHKVRKIECTGSGMGAHIRINATTDSVYENLYVHDGLFSKTEPVTAGSGATAGTYNVADDVLEGIRIADNIRCKLINPQVSRLHGNATIFTRSGAVYTGSGMDYSQSTVKLFPNLRTRGISGGGNVDCIIDNPQVYDAEQAIDLSGSGNGYGNVRVTIQGGHTLDCGSVGVKWGGAQTDCKVIGHLVENSGMYGYIVSGSWRGYKTSGVEMVGCTAVGIGYNDIQNDIGDQGVSTYIQNAYFGFVTLGGYTADSTDDVRYIGCKADAKCFFRLYGDDPASDPARPWPAAGSTTAYLAQPWTGPTGTYSVTFDTSAYLNGDGSPNTAPTIRSETKTVTLTSGSATMTWTGGLLNPVGMPIVARPAYMAYGYGSVLFNDDAATGLKAGAGIPFNQETKKPIALIDCESFGHTIDREIGGFHRDVCYLTASDTPSVANNNPTVAVPFNGEAEDTMTMHDIATNTDRIYPKHPGVYRVRGVVYFEANTTGVRSVDVCKSGVSLFSMPAAPLSGTVTPVQVDYDVLIDTADIAANAYIHLRAYQSSGGSLTLTNNRWVKVERVGTL